MPRNPNVRAPGYQPTPYVPKPVPDVMRPRTLEEQVLMSAQAAVNQDPGGIAGAYQKIGSQLEKLLIDFPLQTLQTATDPQTYTMEEVKGLPGAATEFGKAILEDWTHPLDYAERDPLFFTMDLLGLAALPGAAGRLASKAAAIRDVTGQAAKSAFQRAASGAGDDVLRLITEERGGTAGYGNEWGGMGETLSPEERLAKLKAEVQAERDPGPLLSDADLAAQVAEAPITSFRGEYEFLSNFYKAPVEYEGLRYPTSEAAYQAMKSLDPGYRRRLTLTTGGGEAKRLGRMANLREDWGTSRLSIMEEIVRAKFQQNPELAQKLLATGNRPLVEGNTWGDKFWGQVEGVGENNLGRILEKVRDELRGTTATEAAGTATAAVPAAATEATSAVTRPAWATKPKDIGKYLDSHPDAVYAGRPGKGQKGPWGNPFKMESNTAEAAAASVEKYRAWLEEKVASDPAFAEKVKNLAGKELVCFPHKGPCHAEVLAEVSNRLNGWEGAAPGPTEPNPMPLLRQLDTGEDYVKLRDRGAISEEEFDALITAEAQSPEPPAEMVKSRMGPMMPNKAPEGGYPENVVATPIYRGALEGTPPGETPVMRMGREGPVPMKRPTSWDFPETPHQVVWEGQRQARWGQAPPPKGEEFSLEQLSRSGRTPEDMQPYQAAMGDPEAIELVGLLEDLRLVESERKDFGYGRKPFHSESIAPDEIRLSDVGPSGKVRTAKLPEGTKFYDDPYSRETITWGGMEEVRPRYEVTGDWPEEVRMDIPADLPEGMPVGPSEPVAPTLGQLTTPEMRAANKWRRDESRMRQLAEMARRERDFESGGISSLNPEPEVRNPAWNPVTEEWEYSDVHKLTDKKWAEYPGWSHEEQMWTRAMNDPSRGGPQKPFVPWERDAWLDLDILAEETPTGTPVPGWQRAGIIPHSHSAQEITALRDLDTHRAIMSHLFNGHGIPNDVAVRMMVETEDLGAVDAWHALEHLPSKQLPTLENSTSKWRPVAPESMNILFDEATGRPKDFGGTPQQPLSTMQRLAEDLKAKGMRLLLDETGAVTIDAGQWKFLRRDPIDQAQKSLMDPALMSVFKERFYEIHTADGASHGNIIFHWNDEHPQQVYVSTMTAGGDDLFYNPDYNNSMGVKGLKRVFEEIIQAENPQVEQVRWLGVNSGSHLNANVDRMVEMNIPNRMLHQTNLFPGEEYSMYGSNEMIENAAHLQDAYAAQEGARKLQEYLQYMDSLDLDWLPSQRPRQQQLF